MGMGTSTLGRNMEQRENAACYSHDLPVVFEHKAYNVRAHGTWTFPEDWLNREDKNQSRTNELTVNVEWEPQGTDPLEYIIVKLTTQRFLPFYVEFRLQPGCMKNKDSWPSFSFVYHSTTLPEGAPIDMTIDSKTRKTTFSQKGNVAFQLRTMAPEWVVVEVFREK